MNRRLANAKWGGPLGSVGLMASLRKQSKKRTVTRHPPPKVASKKGVSKLVARPVEAEPKEPEILTIRVSVEAQALPTRAWSAITSPDEINRWFTDRCEFEARPGGRVLYWFSSRVPESPDYVGRSRFGTAAETRIGSWDPPRSFSVRSQTHWPGAVTFRIEPHPLGSRITVEHTGWPKRDAWYKDHAEGWKQAMDLLRNYLEKPESEYDSYLASVEGR